jgi:hypothetical protein
VSGRAASSHRHGVQAGKPRTVNAAAWARRLRRGAAVPAGGGLGPGLGLRRTPRAYS